MTRRGYLALGLLAGLLLVAAVAWQFLDRPRVPGPGQGIAGRRAPLGVPGGELRNLDDPCFSAYRLRPAGRGADGQQHYSLSIVLRDQPGDAAGLAATLAKPACAADLQRLTSSLSAPGGPGAGAAGNLRTSYVSPGGARWLSP